MTNRFCPDCGTALLEPRDLRSHWLRLLRCPSCKYTDFLYVGDSRWIYPMQRLELGILEKILLADDEQIRMAVAHIRRIDYKTISIVEFEDNIRKL